MIFKLFKKINKNVKYIGLYLLVIISFLFVKEIIFYLFDSNSFLFLLGFLFLPSFVSTMLISITPPALFLSYLIYYPLNKLFKNWPYWQKKTADYKDFRWLLFFTLKNIYLSPLNFFDPIYRLIINRLLKHRTIILGFDSMEPTICKEDIIVYKLFNKNHADLDIGEIVICRYKLNILIGRIYSIKDEFILIAPDNKKYLNYYLENFSIPINNIIGIYLFHNPNLELNKK
ncbi:hypothetical protein CU311_07730 [Prochlorococcus marinus str. MU1402]|nr:hypothetical protein [Prochlorococcus marinus str. MU1402]